MNENPTKEVSGVRSWFVEHQDNFSSLYRKELGKPLRLVASALSREEAELIERACNSFPDLFAALQGLLKRYTSLVASGDAGNWDAEKEDEVIAAREAIRKATQI